MLYWFGKIFIAPFFYLLFRPRMLHSRRFRSKGKVIYVCNHFSLADPVALAALCPRTIHFMAREGLFSSPIARFFFWSIFVFPAGEEGGSRLGPVKRALSLLKREKAFGIFPEGHRSAGILEMDEMERGAAFIALRSGASVSPENFDAVALDRAGVHPVERLAQVPAGATLIIRAHGAVPELFGLCRERGIETVDATCPFVKRIHHLVSRAREAGIPVYIAGKKHHPEVIGIAGWAGRGAVILGTAEEAEALPPGEKGCLVAQTTFSRETYRQIGEILKEKIRDLTICPTICDTTRLRQQEAEALSRRCNKMLVLGSANSANTMELAKLCQKNCPNTKTIENIGKISLELFHSNDIIGLVAGASTPDPMIREVIQGMSELEQTTIETIEAEAPAEVVAETAEQPVEAVVETAAVEVPAEEAAPAAEPKDIAEDFETAIDNSIRRIRPGQVVKGTVIGITDNEVLVNVGYKSDGYIPRGEFETNDETKIEDLVKEGDTIDVEVVKVNDGEGNVLLSRKNIQSRKIWDSLLSEENEGKTFDAVVKEVVKGGLIAEIEGGVRAFIPASHVSVKYVENLGEYVGKNVQVKVLEVDKQRKRIVASI